MLSKSIVAKLFSFFNNESIFFLDNLFLLKNTLILPPYLSGNSTFDINKLTLRKTETKQITATVYPATLTEGVTWTSGSDQIASVSTTGLVTAINGDAIAFIHSTTSKGVTTSTLKEKYWYFAFVQARRVL